MLKYLDPDKWDISSGNKVRTILLLANILCFYWLFTSFNWAGFVISFIFYIFIAKIGSDIGTHRYFCHKSFVAKPWVEWMFFISSAMVPFGSPIHWVGVHRLHHEKSDEPNDPHSPHHTGFFKVWTFQLGTHWNISTKYVKDLIRDKRHTFLFKNYFKIYFLYVGITILISVLCGWQWCVYLWALPTTLVLHTSSAINTICHKYGYQTYKTGESSTNNIWLNFLVLGNAMHNNHHGRPQDYSQAGKHWYEFDLWGSLIKHVLMVKPVKN